MFVQDFVLNGSAVGPFARTMDSVRWDAGMLRPYFDKNGQAAVTVNTGRTTLVKGKQVPIREHRLVRDLAQNGIVSPVMNATALRKEEWIEMDRVVLRAARYRLRAWADLAGSNTFGGFNGMSKMMLEYESMSDPGEAQVDMDGLATGRNDQPVFQLEGLPLPITHSDFTLSMRKLAISRNTGTPLDTVLGESAGRRVAETLEKTTIGNQVGIAYGGASTYVGGYGRTSKVYGYLTFPSVLTKTNMTAPATGTFPNLSANASWTPETTQIEFNLCLQTLRANRFTGPFDVYYSPDWDTYLNGDYYVVKTSGAMAPTRLLLERLKAIDGIKDIKRLDMLFPVVNTTGIYSPVTGPGTEYLTGGGGGSSGAWPFTLIFVQQTPDVARAVNGMDITTVQWETKGGMELNFKVMCIQVPQIRADFYGNCGILIATTAP